VRSAGPSRLWYVCASALFALSLLAALALGRAVADAFAVEVSPLPETPVTLPDERLAVFTTEHIAGHNPSCEAQAANGGRYPLELPQVDFTTDIGGREWARIAVTPENLPPGEYVIECGTSGLDSADGELSIGANPNLARAALLIGLAFAIPLAAAVLATAIVVITLLRRRRFRRTAAPAVA